MIKRLVDLTELEKLNMLIDGTSYAMFEAHLDKEAYEKSKKGELEEISEIQERDIKILRILEGLGYPMDELGTYLYKDVIAEAYEKVKDVSSGRDMDKCRELMASLNDAYSDFYRWIARDDKEMGVKSFHFYIGEAISKIDDNSIDKELAIKVFGSNPEDLNYGLQAFQLACYASNRYSMEPDFKKPKVMGLSNSPKSIR